MKLSVVVVTLNRPDAMRRCLECLRAQDRRPDQIVVVDASPDDRTKTVVEEFPEALYLRNQDGYGRMTASRNIGLKSASGDVIAFVDDDAFAHANFCADLLAAYGDDPSIGAVGGRVLPVPPDAQADFGQIGRVTPDGVLLGNFWAEPPSAIDVDHVMGCNMSFRRETLARAGGFRELLVGISGIGEDSDMCLRVRRLGYRIVFAPRAAVDHIGAPQAKGRRFDARYAYAAGRNYTLMLVHNFGLADARPWRFVFWQGTKMIVRGLPRPHHFHRVIAYLAGTFVGLVRGAAINLRVGRDAARQDQQANELRTILSQSPAKDAAQSPRPMSNAI